MLQVLLRGSSGTNNWRYVGINSEHEEGWPNVMIWQGIVPDDTWRYSCLNLQVAIDAEAQAGDSAFSVGDAHEVRQIKFFNDKVSRSTYGHNPFWIDEFSISPTERVVTQTEYPATGSGPLQLINIVRRQDAAEIAWEVTLSTDNVGCSFVKDGLALDFTIEVENIQNLESAGIKQVQQHSPSLQGQIILGFGGKEVKVSTYASANELEDKLMELSLETKVTQTGFLLGNP